MTSVQFQKQINNLRRLSISQSVTRLFIRAMWVLFGGYLLGWSANRLWGILENFSYWWIGIGLSIFVVAVYLFGVRNRGGFSWQLDRKLELKEQVSAALEISDKGDSLTNLQRELLEDVGKGLLPEARVQIQIKGWFVGREFESLIAIGFLLLAVYLSGFSTIPDLPNSSSANLPAVVEEPAFEDIFPSGIPGLTSQEAQDLGIEENDRAISFSNEELDEVADVLENLGEALSEQAATAELGDALQRGDLDTAASELEQLSGQLDQLSDDSKAQFSEALQDAADDLRQPGQQELSNALSNAASSLQNGDNSDASENVDSLAQQIAGLGDFLENQNGEAIGFQSNKPPEQTQEGAGEGGGGAGSASGSSGPQTEPFERIGENAEILDFTSLSEQSGVLTPGNSLNVGEGSVSGSTLGNAQGLVAEGAAYTPFQFSWMNRDVVEAYFSPH